MIVNSILIKKIRDSQPQQENNTNFTESNQNLSLMNISNTVSLSSPVSSKEKSPKKGKGKIEPELPELQNILKEATWKKGERAPYLHIAHTFSEIEKVTSRLRIIELLSNMLLLVMELTPEDLLACVYLCLNKLGPAWRTSEMGVGETILMRSIAETTGRTMSAIKESLKQYGDLGTVAQKSRSPQRMLFKPTPLTVHNVFEKFKILTSTKGKESQDKKKDIINNLLLSCRDEEPTYIFRSLQGTLRIGIQERSVLNALSVATVMYEYSKTESGKKSLRDKEKKKSTR